MQAAIPAGCVHTETRRRSQQAHSNSPTGHNPSAHPPTSGETESGLCTQWRAARVLLETTARRSSETRSRQKPDTEVCMVGLPRVRCPQKTGSRRRRYVSVSWGWGGQQRQDRPQKGSRECPGVTETLQHRGVVMAAQLRKLTKTY